jgi:hypothetical protein
MSKMGSHDPYGHLTHKLWLKEWSGVKFTSNQRDSNLNDIINLSDIG